MQNYTIDKDTLQWWREQSKEAKSAFSDSEQVTINSALILFNQFFTSHTPQKIWSHGSYDIVHLENAYKKSQIKTPWTFRQVMDSRTLFNTTEIINPDRSQGTHHNAVNDAIIQAKAVQQFYKRYFENEQV